MLQVPAASDEYVCMFFKAVIHFECFLNLSHVCRPSEVLFKTGQGALASLGFDASPDVANAVFKALSCCPVGASRLMLARPSI